MNKKTLTKTTLAVTLLIGTSFFLFKDKEKNYEEIKSDDIVYSTNETTTTIEDKLDKETAWESLIKTGIIKDEKIQSKYLEIPELKTTASANTTTPTTTIINKETDLTGYIKLTDRTEGNDIEGIFSDLRIKWESGEDYYNDKYMKREEKASGDLEGKYKNDITVLWENGKSYYDTLYQPLGESSGSDVSELNDLSDVNLDIAATNDDVEDYAMVWDSNSQKWVTEQMAKVINLGNGIQTLSNAGADYIGLGGTLRENTSLDTSGKTLTLESESKNTAEYMQLNEDIVTIDTLLKIGEDNLGAIQLSSYASMDPKPECSTTLEGAVTYDNELKLVCFCNGSNWRRIEDSTSACFIPQE